MSINHWKILHQIKDTLIKYTNRDALYGIYNKLPENVSTKEYARILSQLLSKDSGSATTIVKSPPSLVTVKPPAPNDIGDIQVTPTVHHVSSAKNDDTGDNKSTVVKQWQTRVIAAPIQVINTRTQQLLLDIESSPEPHPKLADHLEALCRHFEQFPEAKISAVRFGAIRLLLKIRARTQRTAVLEPLRECLARLGHVDPVARHGIRILSVDGGGIRGLIVLQMLKKLEELSGHRIHELFDLFCGVSTGALLTMALGVHAHTLDEITEGYKEISNEVFKQSPFWGTSNLVWSQSYYDTGLWERKLKENLGEATLISTARRHNIPKLLAVSAIVNQSQLSAYVFRNYSLPWRIKSHYFGSSRHRLWEAARASAAAPTYFEEFKLGRYLHQDGGILVNNPTAVAIHEAKLLWPTTPIQCVVSFGTGRIVPNLADFAQDTQVNNTVIGGGGGVGSSNTSWTDKFYKILDSATDTEGVNIMLNDLLPAHVYYRFNPYLTNVVSMVEIDPDKLDQMEMDVIMYLSRNEEKFNEAAKRLIEAKTFRQKCTDYINHKRILYDQMRHL